MTSNIQVYEPKHSPACILMDHNGPQQPNEEAASPVRRRLATGSEAKFPQLVFEGLKVGSKGKVDFVPFFSGKKTLDDSSIRLSLKVQVREVKKDSLRIHGRYL